VPDVRPEQQAPITALVDQLLTEKINDPKAGISVLEATIDHLVRQLYGLTEEENVVEEGKA